MISYVIEKNNGIKKRKEMAEMGVELACSGQRMGARHGELK